MAIYDQIGKVYDTTRRADPFITSRLVEFLNLDPEKTYLDIACGTGNYTSALEGKGGSWFGVDQSIQMIEKARVKGNAVNWQIGDITSLPFGEDTFGGAICTLAIHHFPELNSPFREVRRVLKDGSFVIFTSTQEQTGNYWLAEYFPEAIRRSAEQMPKRETILECLDNAGFTKIETENYSVKEDLEDFFLYNGKFRPELYLDPQIRANISTFSLLANEDEIRSGCQKLASDIETGKIKDVILRHRGSDDYLFVVASV
ncbi:MAG: methyltransferase domain-containing protein [Acidobacteria bacterium]|nr:methyltransferase domain-containing protein [Acidobacteriota bacterium]